MDTRKKLLPSSYGKARIIDANLNRAIEALRVIEEYARFIYLDAKLTIRLKQLRHTLAKDSKPEDKKQLLNARNTAHDMRSDEINPSRKDLSELLQANFSRLQEALRVLEEYTGKSLYNRARYQSYDLEKEILLPLLKKTLKRGIYVISDQEDILINSLNEGASIIQLRDKKASKAAIYNKAFRLAKQAREKNIPFIVNDFLDIAIAVDADGFHSGQDDLPIDTLRELIGPNKILGRSTHNVKQGLIAQKQGADYVSVGPIFETPSKPGRDAIGFDYLKEAQQKLHIPFVVIGGIDHQNIQDVLHYSPPMIGIIRDVKHLKALKTHFDNKALNQKT